MKLKLGDTANLNRSRQFAHDSQFYSVGDLFWLKLASNAVKRLGQFFVLFREISFTMKWKHEQRYI